MHTRVFLTFFEVVGTSVKHVLVFCLIFSAKTISKEKLEKLKGLGHAILGNFSTDQMVIELTKIWKERLKTIEELKQNKGKPRRGMDGQTWRGLRWIAFG